MLKVGISKIDCDNGRKILDYNSVDYDDDDYADAKVYTPKDFDLCILVTRDGLTKKGWWTGQSYWGHRLHSDEVVISWKKCKDLF